MIPAGSRPYYCFGSLALYRDASVIVPMGADDCAFGRGPVLLHARDSGRLILYPFASAGGTYLGIITAVYRHGAVPATLAGRRAAFIGWVGSLVSANVVLRAALLGHPHTTVTLSQSVVGSHAPPIVLTLGTSPPGATRASVDLHNGSSITTWAAVAGSSVFAHGDSVALLSGGGLVSLLVGLLVLTLGTGRARALRLVTEKTGQLSYQAMHDGLTGLPNRALLTDRADQMLARARRTDTRVAVLFIDVDGFKQVNDNHGHAAGDELLQAVASRLAGLLRGGDTVGRQGGDEFVALLEADREGKPEAVAERMLELLRRPIVLAAAHGRTVRTTSSIGIAVGQRATADELMGDADLALYQAKAAGKDRYVLFEESMQVEAADRWALRAACHQAQAWADEFQALDMLVRVSAPQLRSAALVFDVRGALADSGLDPRRLTLAVTEKVLLSNPEVAGSRLSALKDLGVRIAVDDFGAGYRSLAHLRRFPVDSLKFDRSFIAGVSSSAEAAALMDTLIGLGKLLGLETLGQGADLLVPEPARRPDPAERRPGFLSAPPMDIEAIARFLRDPLARIRHRPVTGH